MSAYVRIPLRMLIVMLVLVLALPTAYASHGDGLSSTARKNIGKLGKRAVEEVPVPILLGVSLTDIQPNFGEARDGGKRSHEGLDIMAPLGTPIVSPTKAVVIRKGTGDSAGKYVYTRNPGGETFAYLHLDQIAAINVGELLDVGDVIGTVGDTGNAQGTAPHLHFEIIKSSPLDPYPRITKEFTLEEKIMFLNASISELKKDKQYIPRIVNEHGGLLAEAQREGYELNKTLGAAVKKQVASFALETSAVGIREGASGEGVRLLQTALIHAAVGTSSRELRETGATGFFGPLTKRALIEFQRREQIAADGVLTLATKRALEAEMKAIASVKGVAISHGSADTVLEQVVAVIPHDLWLGREGGDVALVQSVLMLKASGTAADALMVEGATGYFGALTEAALREFQRTQGIPETGVYDANTRSILSVS